MSKLRFILPFIAIISLIFSSCGSESAGSAKILAAEDGLLVIEATADGGSLEDALNALSDAGELTYSGSSGDYGLFLTAVNGREADLSKNEYWALYTTLGELDGVAYSNEEFGSYDYDGRVCASASYGVSGLIMVEGEIYVLTVESY